MLLKFSAGNGITTPLNPKELNTSENTLAYLLQLFPTPTKPIDQSKKTKKKNPKEKPNKKKLAKDPLEAAELEEEAEEEDKNKFDFGNSNIKFF
jgi:hypothetical protein